jgi:hypothetical protein
MLGSQKKHRLSSFVPILVTLLALFIKGSQARAGEQPPTQEQLEAERIAASSGHAERHGSTLLIHAANGQDQAFQNEKMCGDGGRVFDIQHCTKYVFLGHLADRHGSLVLAGYYESAGYFWISDVTGKKVAIGGEPHFSPNGQRFAVAVPNESEGFNGIQVWRWQHDDAAIEFEYEPKEYALYDFSKWNGDEKVVLKVTTYIDHKLAETSAHLTKTATGWNLSGPTEASK